MTDCGEEKEKEKEQEPKKKKVQEEVKEENQYSRIGNKTESIKRKEIITKRRI